MATPVRTAAYDPALLGVRVDETGRRAAAPQPVSPQQTVQERQREPVPASVPSSTPARKFTAADSAAIRRQTPTPAPTDAREDAKVRAAVTEYNKLLTEAERTGDVNPLIQNLRWNREYLSQVTNVDTIIDNLIRHQRASAPIPSSTPARKLTAADSAAIQRQMDAREITKRQLSSQAYEKYVGVPAPSKPTVATPDQFIGNVFTVFKKAISATPGTTARAAETVSTMDTRLEKTFKDTGMRSAAGKYGVAGSVAHGLMDIPVGIAALPESLVKAGAVTAVDPGRTPQRITAFGSVMAETAKEDPVRFVTPFVVPFVPKGIRGVRTITKPAAIPKSAITLAPQAAAPSIAISEGVSSIRATPWVAAQKGLRAARKVQAGVSEITPRIRSGGAFVRETPWVAAQKGLRAARKVQAIPGQIRSQRLRASIRKAEVDKMVDEAHAAALAGEKPVGVYYAGYPIQIQKPQIVAPTAPITKPTMAPSFITPAFSVSITAPRTGMRDKPDSITAPRAPITKPTTPPSFITPAFSVIIAAPRTGMRFKPDTITVPATEAAIHTAFDTMSKTKPDTKSMFDTIQFPKFDITTIQDTRPVNDTTFMTITTPRPATTTISRTTTQTRTKPRTKPRKARKPVTLPKTVSKPKTRKKRFKIDLFPEKKPRKRATRRTTGISFFEIAPVSRRLF